MKQDDESPTTDEAPATPTPPKSSPGDLASAMSSDAAKERWSRISSEQRTAWGQMLGTARNTKLSAEQRRKIASSGGRARHKKLTPEEKSAIARKAAIARWIKRKSK